MASKNSKTPVRKPRADAERNRQRLLDVAKEILAAKGSSASLEEIARTAGVGIGTLYRHFPTRDALVEEVYRDELGHLTNAAEHLAETLTPVEALRAYMVLFVEYTAKKQGMSEALNSLTGGTSALYASSTDRIREGMNLLIERGVAAGEIRPIDDPLDLLRALAGISNQGATSSWKAGAIQMIDILIAGVRVAPSSSPSKPKPRR